MLWPLLGYDIMKDWNPHKLKDPNTGEVLNYIPSFTNWRLSFAKRALERTIEREASLSIIIQGPLNDRSISTIPSYLNYGEVIVSCWDTDDLSRLDTYKDKIKIIVSKFSDTQSYPRRPGSQSPWILQNMTTRNALRVATGFSSIKLRSDESFPILDPVIDKLKTNRDSKNEETGAFNWFKIVTSNIYFRHDIEKKFHPSDHIIAGQTSRMKEIFEYSCKLCSKKQEIKFPEQLICQAVIETYRDPILKRYDYLDFSNSVNLMKKHFDIVRIRDLPQRIWTSSYRKYDKLFGEEIWCHDINDIGIGY